MLCLFSHFITKTRLFKYIENFTFKKTENFQIKISDIFHISAQNIDCGYSLKLPRRGGYNEYPQSMFWADIRKIMFTPVNPTFAIKKWGLRGSNLYRYVFVMFVTLLFFLWCLWMAALRYGAPGYLRFYLSITIWSRNTRKPQIGPCQARLQTLIVMAPTFGNINEVNHDIKHQTVLIFFCGL